MKELKSILLILITLAILISAGFYCWNIYQKQVLHQEKENCRLDCLLRMENISSTNKLKNCKLLCDYLPGLPNLSE